MTRAQLKFGGKTNTYTYYYHADGRERQIVGSGSKKAKGTTNFTYDANDKQIRIEKGKGDGMDAAEAEAELPVVIVLIGEVVSAEQVEHATSQGVASKASQVLDKVVGAADALGQLASRLDPDSLFLLEMGVSLAQAAVTGAPVKQVVTNFVKDVVGNYVSDKVQSAVSSYFQDKLGFEPATATILGLGTSFGVDVIIGSGGQIVDDAKNVSRAVADQSLISRPD